MPTLCGGRIAVFLDVMPMGKGPTRLLLRIPDRSAGTILFVKRLSSTAAGRESS
jgi:hypothetical protein